MIPMTLTEQRLASAHEQIARMRHYLELIREQTGEWRDWPDLENSDIKQAAPFLCLLGGIEWCCQAGLGEVADHRSSNPTAEGDPCRST